MIELLPVKREYVFAQFQMPLHHSDPNDRTIISTAIVEKMPVVSGDEAFLSYEGLEIIWR